MEPRAFLQLAQQLARDTTNEASLRSSVSRGYYALFNSMAQFIDENVEKLDQTANDHKRVYFYFNNCEVEDVKTIASALNDLREDRNESDYKLRSNRFKDQHLVSFLYKKASKAFNSFEKIVENSERCTNIVKAIRKYKQATNS